METAEFGSSSDVFTWLGQFVNMEQGVKPPSMRPERMQIIAAAAGHPEAAIPAVHVAGSKGKGSVTALVSAILHDGGYRVARYLSPHISEYRERITLDGAFFEEAVYIEAGNELQAAAQAFCTPETSWYRALAEVSDGASPLPTFFELLTLYFFLCARRAECNALAVETGMGGRLDPTNIVQSRAAVITGIELEHTDILGDTVALIASEKAGIIKPARPVIVGTQVHKDASAALAAFSKTARESAAPLYYFPQTACIENLRHNAEGVSWTLRSLNAEFFTGAEEFGISLHGAIQAENASLAILAVLKAFPDIPMETIRRAIRRVSLPARFERLSTAPSVVIDGAHTAVSMRLCAQTWKEMYGAEGILLFGCAQDKNATAMAQTLLPCFAKVIITTPGTFKASNPEQVFAVFQETARLTGYAGERILLIPDTRAAIETALTAAKQESRPVLGTGSFYLTAEIRALFGSEPA